MPIVKLLKRAELELIDSCDWYEKQQKGLSLRFRKEIKKSLESINSDPLLYAKRYDTELRFSLLKKFPFIIIYWYDARINTVFVVSIFHTNRNPEKI